MNNNPQTKRNGILVVSLNSRLADLSRQAVEGRYPVEYAADEQSARNIIEHLHPDMIIIGNLASHEASLRFYEQLKEGWISRHSSLVLVEWDKDVDKCRMTNGENLAVGAGEFTFLGGATSPLLPVDYFLPRLKELIEKKMEQRVNKLKRSMLDSTSFCITWEQIPGPGAFEIRQELVLENARTAAEGKKVCAISIVDNPGGNPAIATEILCTEIRKFGIEPVVHLAFRDKNRNQTESLLFQLAALDINNLLVLCGDYPSNNGFHGTSMPVFDLDAVNGLQLIKLMNQGLEHEILRKTTRLAPTDFFTGVALSPNKRLEAEVMGQYYKLGKKIAAGADFVNLQIGYDARKWHEVIQWMKINHHNLPVLASIQVLTLPTARTMNANRVPGCVVSDKLLARVTEESKAPDKGAAARLERAAKMFALAKGLGFKGACISGHNLAYKEVDYIIERGHQMSENWRDYVAEFDFPQETGFYYFTREEHSGLNSAEPSLRRQRGGRPLIFFLSKMVHHSLFEPKSILFKPMRGLMRFTSRHKKLEKALHAVEHLTKTVLYSCQDCGDCAIFDVAYLCPVSQCPKGQRNGPCGGGYNGWCEVYPGEKQCVWVKAYLRLKADKNEESIGRNLVPPCNHALKYTSSWVNYFTGKDHVSQRIMGRDKETH